MLTLFHHGMNLADDLPRTAEENIIREFTNSKSSHALQPHIARTNDVHNTESGRKVTVMGMWIVSFQVGIHIFHL